MWWLYSLLSAFFAALTAVFAKIGIKNANTDPAAAVRTVVILISAWRIAYFRNSLNSLLNKFRREFYIRRLKEPLIF